MKEIKVKGGFNRFRIVDAGGFTVGIIEITQIGLEAEIGIVEKGVLYQSFEMRPTLKGARARARIVEKRERKQSRVEQISRALGKIKGGVNSLWNISKRVYEFLITGNNLMFVVVELIVIYAAIITVLGMV